MLTIHSSFIQDRFQRVNLFLTGVTLDLTVTGSTNGLVEMHVLVLYLFLSGSLLCSLYGSSGVNQLIENTT